ncbi:UbiA prenyltransferase family protein [Treponema sp. OMZ 792]|uniref:UbiA family prenyltransferase n=1 Tax=unclassified Treponema TaxID=2638727 RepID=UPI0020A38187|nr:MULTISPECIES: UbiA family prenyltransferase [unclassified Treponema]UTC64406.1 UbiA prenyltransferase family protein [Treponema sp. OMZ 788]UTC75005.1 UbiA prenyltransferase family protein [Treponema sp. OMZ 792]UTC81400.1 hypothetical protein E4O07_12540 [Treponema sp. OMZ 798]
METENLFDRFGAVLKDYIDDEDAQKRRYAKRPLPTGCFSAGGTANKGRKRYVFCAKTR